MRVHELAKELNISSKAITDMLSNADKKYTAMSGLGESEINSVKSKFTKAAGNTANKSGPKKAEEKQVKSEENKNIKAQEIASQLEEKKDMRKAMIYLQKYGISTKLAAKIYQYY